MLVPVFQIFEDVILLERLQVNSWPFIGFAMLIRAVIVIITVGMFQYVSSSL